MNTPDHPLRQIPRNNWPVQVDMLAKVIGPESAMNLFIRFNGVTLHIPFTKNLHDEHVIVKTIGLNKAKQLCEYFAAEEILFPKGAYLLRKIRNKNIIEDYRSGMTQIEIATKYDLTSRCINGIISNFNKTGHHYDPTK